jgi:hypothetical protein
MALSATDEFWHSPIDSGEGSDCSSSSSSSSMMDLLPASIPPAHEQLLSDEKASFAELTGYDHKRQESRVVSYDSLIDPLSDCEDDSSSPQSSSTLLSTKALGGGSWLLGFARLSNGDKPTSEDDEEAPGLVRDESDEDDDSSTDDSDVDDEGSLSSSAHSTSKPALKRRSGVSFASTVAVQPIPHSSTLTPLQRRKMYSSSFEVRQNKIRNKREYRYDGYDWRNVTEEWEMGVDMVTGELVHPAHEH